jgi:N-acetylmuramoyl-L-alanine amidase
MIISRSRLRMARPSLFSLVLDILAACVVSCLLLLGIAGRPACAFAAESFQNDSVAVAQGTDQSQSDSDAAITADVEATASSDAASDPSAESLASNGAATAEASAPAESTSSESAAAASADSDALATDSSSVAAPDASTATDSTDAGAASAQADAQAAVTEGSDGEPVASLTAGLVYVDLSTIDAGQTQSVAILFDQEVAIDGARLSVTFPDGSSQAFEATSLVDGAALFRFVAPSAGSYTLDSVEVSVAGYDQPTTVSLASDETGEKCSFSAAATSQVSALSASLVSATAAESSSASGSGDQSFYAIDQNGSEVVASSLSQALAVAGDSDSGGTDASDSDGSSDEDGEDDGSLTIVIDPGHGGEDSGALGYALGYQMKESDINWKIAMACKEALESHGYTVILTRGENECPTIAARAQVAIDAHADLLLCLHTNEYDDPSANGCMVFYPNSESTWHHEIVSVGENISQRIVDKLSALGLNNDGVRVWTDGADEVSLYPDGNSVSDHLGIIRYARMQGVLSVLVEHAFISSPHDAALLASDDFLVSLGEADANAVIEYFESTYKGWHDVLPTDWFVTEGSEEGEGYFDYVVNHGIVVGYKDSEGNSTHYFGPNEAITREQAITMLYRIANPDSTATTDPENYLEDTDFIDDTPNSYSNAAIQWGKDNGIVIGDTGADGNPTGTFRPNDSITREEFATLVARFASVYGGISTQGDESLLSDYPDGSDVSDYAREAVSWCVESGIITGDQEWDPARLNPQGTTLRCQAAKILTVLVRDTLS